MKRALLSFAISSIAFIGISGCQPKAPDTNREAMKPANANMAKETVNPAVIEEEVTKLEKDWASAEQHHDVDAIRKILADDVVMTYADGTTGTKARELSDTEAGSFTADSWELFDTKVTVLSADSAVITGRSVLKNAKYKDQKTKATIDISGQYRFTDVYARRNGQWQAVASQTTFIVKPAPTPSPVASPKPSETASPM